MVVVFLTNASSSPWSKPIDWSDSGHTIELVGCGGMGGNGTTGVSGRSGDGGGGGAYLKLTYSSGALLSTTGFQIFALNSNTTSSNASATIWLSNTLTTNCYYASAGECGTSAGFANSPGGLGGNVGATTPVVYTRTTNNAGGQGGGANNSTWGAAGGGAGAGGPHGLGSNGGAAAPANTGGSGGGGSDGGAIGGVRVANFANGANGGTNRSATGAGVGANATVQTGGAGSTGAGGGGGHFTAAATANTWGGNGSFEVIWTQTSDSSTAGSGGGGGGGACQSNNSAGSNTSGGRGANYGGGGGGGAGARATSANTQGATPGGGLIVITYTSIDSFTLTGATFTLGAGTFSFPKTNANPIGVALLSNAGSFDSNTYYNNISRRTQSLQFNPTFDATDTGWQGYAIRQIVSNSQIIGANTGTEIQLNIDFTSATTKYLTINEVWAGEQQDQTLNLIARSDYMGSSGGSNFGNAHNTLTYTQVDPFGGTTAVKLVEDTATTVTHDIYRNSIAKAAGGVNVPMTFSFYAKPGARTRCAAYFYGVNNGLGAVFDLAGGQMGVAAYEFHPGGGEDVWTNFSAGITTDNFATGSGGNGWYRCWIKGVSSNVSVFGVDVTPDSNTGTGTESSTYTGDGTSEIYLAGFQVVDNLVLKDYTPCNPWSWDGGGFPPNLIIHPEAISNTTWWNGPTNVSVVRWAADPFGSFIAVKIVENTAATAQHQVRTTIDKPAASTDYIYSYYLKPNGRRAELILFDDNGEMYAGFDLVGGQVAYSGTTGTGWTLGGSGVTTDNFATGSGGNGWYRCWIKGTSSADVYVSPTLELDSNTGTNPASVSYTGDGSSGVYAAGPQVVRGSTLPAYGIGPVQFTFPIYEQMTGTLGAAQAPGGWGGVGTDGLNPLTLVDPGTVDGFITYAVQIRETAAGGYQGMYWLNPIVNFIDGTTYTLSAYIRIPTGVTASDAYVYSWGSAPGTLIASASTLNAQPKDVWVKYSTSHTYSASIDGPVGGYLEIINPGAATGTGFDIARITISPQVGSYLTFTNDTHPLEVSLLHFDGTDASTTITESGIHSHTWTVHGSAQLDTSKFEFGTAALQLVAATSDYVSGDGSTDFSFGTGDFTIDHWFWWDGTGTNPTLFDWRGGGTDGARPAPFIATASSNVVSTWYNGGFQLLGTTPVTASAWHHFALTRSGTAMRMFLDGNLESTIFDASSIDTGSVTAPWLGYNGTFVFTGWIDEFRVIKGRAAWTANFTPPTTSYGPSVLYTISSNWAKLNFSKSKNLIVYWRGTGGEQDHPAVFSTISPIYWSQYNATDDSSTLGLPIYEVYHFTDALTIYTSTISSSVAVTTAVQGSSLSTNTGTLTTTGGGGGGTTANITGASESILAGLLTDAITKALTGNNVTLNAGSNLISIAKALTGTSITDLAGTLITTIAKAITGASLTDSAGNLKITEIPTLTGISATDSAGSLAESITDTITGPNITGSPGTFADTLTITLSGSSLINAVSGSLGPVMRMSGASISACTGVLWFTATSSITTSNNCTWSPTDHSTDITLTVDKLTANLAAGFSNYENVRGTLGRSAGKYYFEVKCSGNSVTQDNGVGIAQGNASLTVGQFFGINTTSWSYFQDGTIYNQNSPQTTGDAWDANTIIGVAVDLDNQLFWVAANNAWEPTGQGFSPSSNNGGRSTTWAGGTVVYPGATLFANSTTATTAQSNFGNTSFVYTLPTGYTAWGSATIPTSVITPQGIKVNILAGPMLALPPNTLILTGAAVTSALGSLIPQVLLPLLGSSVTTNAASTSVADTDTITGAFITDQAGLLFTTIAAIVTGASVTDSAGNLALSITDTLTGPNITGSPGSFTDTLQFTITGTPTTTFAGSLLGPINVLLTGISVTAQAGTVTVQAGSSTTVNITGVSATTAVGSLIPQVILSLLGSSVTANVASTSEADTNTITGASIADQAGLLFATIVKAITGASITDQAGLLSITDTKTLIGASLTDSAGSFAFSISDTMTGPNITGSSGTFADTLTITLTGASTTTSPGSFAKTISVTLTGASVTDQAGSLIAAISRALTGASETLSAGSVAITIASPQGTNITGSLGSFADTLQFVLTGTNSTVTAGSVAVSGAGVVAIFGVSGQASAGTITTAIQFLLNGASISVQSGTPTANVGSRIIGTSTSLSPGTLTKTIAITINAATTISGGSFSEALVRAIIGAQLTTNASPPTIIIKPNISSGVIVEATSNLRIIVSPTFTGTSASIQNGTLSLASTIILSGAAEAVSGSIILENIPIFTGADVTAATGIGFEDIPELTGAGIFVSGNLATKSIKIIGAVVDAEAGILTVILLQDQIVYRANLHITMTHALIDVEPSTQSNVELSLPLSLINIDSKPGE